MLPTTHICNFISQTNSNLKHKFQMTVVEAMLSGGERLSPTESKMRPGIEQSEDD
jgi:hypothetical protein